MDRKKGTKTMIKINKIFIKIYSSGMILSIIMTIAIVTLIYSTTKTRNITSLTHRIYQPFIRDKRIEEEIASFHSIQQLREILKLMDFWRRKRQMMIMIIVFVRSS